MRSRACQSGRQEEAQHVLVERVGNERPPERQPGEIPRRRDAPHAGARGPGVGTGLRRRPRRSRRDLPAPRTLRASRAAREAASPTAPASMTIASRISSAPGTAGSAAASTRMTSAPGTIVATASAEGRRAEDSENGAAPGPIHRDRAGRAIARRRPTISASRLPVPSTTSAGCDCPSAGSRTDFGAEARPRPRPRRPRAMMANGMRTPARATPAEHGRIVTSGGAASDSAGARIAKQPAAATRRGPPPCATAAPATSDPEHAGGDQDSFRIDGLAQEGEPPEPGDEREVAESATVSCVPVLQHIASIAGITNSVRQPSANVTGTARSGRATRGAGARPRRRSRQARRRRAPAGRATPEM